MSNKNLSYSGYTNAKNIKEPDLGMASILPGTVMGEVFRRFWQPILEVNKINDLPVPVRILGEDLVVFKTKRGEYGCVAEHCAHRGASLKYGKIEEEGIRCCYHGWYFKTNGKCIEMPCEKEGICQHMGVFQPSYPVMEKYGLLFVYMGPQDKFPAFPNFDLLDIGNSTTHKIRGIALWGDYSIGMVDECNWLQHYENVNDPWHVMVLHKKNSGDQFSGAMMQVDDPEITFEETPLGICYKFSGMLPNGNRLVRYAQTVVPNIYLVPSIHVKPEPIVSKSLCTEVSWVVPIDDTHIRGFSLAVWPVGANGDFLDDHQPGTSTSIPNRPGSHDLKARSFEDKQRRPDDKEAQEGQRPIAVHDYENLAPSDRGVSLLRRCLKKQIKDVLNGEDPQNFIAHDSPEAEKVIKTRSWNTVLGPTDAVNYSGEEV